ncbi:MAG: T9SS type A sorting domain-containing protein [Chitinophagaceae bacterium]
MTIAILQNGKIIVVSEYYPNVNNVDIGIICVNSNGTLDSSFGTNGLTTTSIDVLNYPRSVAIQPDGKIVVSGDVRKSQYDQKRTFLLRLNSDGVLDNTFGNEGIAITNYVNNTNNKQVIIRPDGKLLTAATFTNPSHPIYLVQCYNTDGTFDESFGTNGKAQYIFGEGQSGLWNNEFNAMALQQDGKIVCTGISGEYEQILMALCRFNADGTVDESFGVNGGITYTNNDPHPENRSIDIQEDGKIVTCGDFADEQGSFLISRFTVNGQLDADFGTNGIASFKIENYPAGNNIHCLKDNKILVTGDVKLSPNIILFRLNGDNVLAANFKEVKATQNNDAITITWQTLNESGTKSFTVERSSNATDYAGINTVPAKGVASNYSYTDKNPLDGISYYRIRENAANGTNTFSPVVKVVFNDNGIISLYPNPAKNTVTVKGLNKNVTAIIKITDMQGREISSQNFTQSSSATLNIRALAIGTYFVQVAQDNKIVRLKLIRE